AVRVVVRPGGGAGPGAVRAQTVGDDELALPDRRPAAWRHTGAERARRPLAGHAEGGVRLDDQRGRLDRPPGHRRGGPRERPERCGLGPRKDPVAVRGSACYTRRPCQFLDSRRAALEELNRVSVVDDLVMAHGWEGAR